MMPRLGRTYPVTIETTSKPKADYMTDEWFEQDLPVAPAIMAGDDIVVEGQDISDHDLESAICHHLGLKPPSPTVEGFFRRFFK